MISAKHIICMLTFGMGLWAQAAEEPFCIWNLNDSTVRLVAQVADRDHATHLDIDPGACVHLPVIPQKVCIITNTLSRRDITTDSAQIGSQMGLKPTAKLTWDIPDGLQFILITPEESAEGANKCYLELDGTFVSTQKVAFCLCACLSHTRHTRRQLHGNVKNSQLGIDIYSNGRWSDVAQFHSKRLSITGLMPEPDN